jgi:hypothetical protein
LPSSGHFVDHDNPAKPADKEPGADRCALQRHETKLHRVTTRVSNQNNLTHYKQR